MGSEMCIRDSFGKTPRQLAREGRDARSLGDKLPSEFLDHVMGLVPDIRSFYEVALLDALPDNAKVAALQHSDLFAMAKAADAVVLESRALERSDRALPAINSLSLLDSDVADAGAPPLQPVVAAVGSGSRSFARSDGLCSAHARWGKDTYKCQAPRTCKMRGVLSKRPSPSPSTSSATASGNAKAGGK